MSEQVFTVRELLVAAFLGLGGGLLIGMYVARKKRAAEEEMLWAPEGFALSRAPVGVLDIAVERGKRVAEVV